MRICAMRGIDPSPGRTFESMNTTPAILAEDRNALRAEARPLDADRDAFVEAMAAAPTAVTVVVHSDGEQVTGQTVSAFASVTADPPTLLVCINQRSRLSSLLRPGELFSVNLLAPEQSAIADSFAGRHGAELEPYDTGRVDWVDRAGGVRTVSGAASSFECSVEAHHLQGTHGIVVARVLASHRSAEASFGLSYCQRGYRALTPAEFR